MEKGAKTPDIGDEIPHKDQRIHKSGWIKNATIWNEWNVEPLDEKV